ncbi:ABC transporter ATP-binding protein [Chloroflexia bacterium SDU3-3]|nr:ABC transporter ATP-binding protein [Chloroflexia bacterium SDU3-3]
MAIVETRDLTRTYGSTLALDHLTLEIPEGAIYGFIGPNGAGKTTTMRILTTLLAPSSGDAWVDGISVRANPRGVRRLVGFMPDYFGVYSGMKAWEYLDFFGRANHVPATRRAQLIPEVLELVDLGHKRDDDVMGLSRGMKQRLSLARTMMHDPRLLILDEPASGLDPRARIELRELLKELSALGKTIMISSHILTELAEMCTHIGIIERGRLLATGSVEHILRSLQPHRTIELRILGDAEPATLLLGQIPGITNVRGEQPAPEEIAPEPTEEGAPAPAGQPTTTLLADFSGDERSQAELLARLVGAGILVTRFAEQQSDLEDIFMQVTRGLVQ